ncbi:MAG: ROK family protein [Candidatus Limnocylindria bacterium]
MEQPADQPVLAIDLGGTQIRAALITPDLTVHHRRAEPTADEDGVDSVVGRICEVAAAVRDDAATAGLPKPIGIAIASPGPLDPWRGVVLDAPNLAGWHDVPLAERLSTAVGLPAFLERDTNVAIIAEWRHGAARGTRHAIYVTVSTGIGGGIIADGRLLTGIDGTAGEVGHLTVELDGPICGCGGIGHAEAIGSGTALAREARSLLESDASPRLAELAAAGDEVDAELLARAAADGDLASGAVFERAWEAIGAMCASLVNLVAPEVIVIGGSIAQHQPQLFDIVRAEIARRSFEHHARRVRLARPHFGPDVSLIGGLPIVNDRIDDPAFAGGSHLPPGAASAVQGATHP